MILVEKQNNTRLEPLSSLPTLPGKSSLLSVGKNMLARLFDITASSSVSQSDDEQRFFDSC